jgi:hypothetical protein
LVVVVFPSVAIAASLESVSSSDKSFCERVLQLFDKNMGNGKRMNVAAEPFDRIRWEEVRLVGTGPSTRHCSSLDKSVMDLDNDGTQDLVIKTTFCMKGRPSDSLYVFPADSRVLEQISWQDLSALLATSDKFERTGGTYPLTALPISGSARPTPSLQTVFTVQPFALDEQTYVAMTDAQGEWIVVAKYARGERFEDHCYFKAASK